MNYKFYPYAVFLFITLLSGRVFSEEPVSLTCTYDLYGKDWIQNFDVYLKAEKVLLKPIYMFKKWPGITTKDFLQPEKETITYYSEITDNYIRLIEKHKNVNGKSSFEVIHINRYTMQSRRVAVYKKNGSEYNRRELSGNCQLSSNRAF